MSAPEMIQNILMTVLLFPISMAMVTLYMKLTGPFDRKMFWFVVWILYGVGLFVCWGVELGYLKQMIH